MAQPERLISARSGLSSSVDKQTFAEAYGCAGMLHLLGNPGTRSGAGYKCRGSMKHDVLP